MPVLKEKLVNLRVNFLYIEIPINHQLQLN